MDKGGGGDDSSRRVKDRKGRGKDYHVELLTNRWAGYQLTLKKQKGEAEWVPGEDALGDNRRDWKRRAGNGRWKSSWIGAVIVSSLVPAVG